MSATRQAARARKLLAVVVVAVGWAILALTVARPSTADIAFSQDIPLTTTGDFLNGSFLRTGVVNNAGGEIQLLPIGVAGVWITDSQQLPIARTMLGVVASGNRIYAAGGADKFGLPNAQVYSTTVVGANLTTWVTQSSSLPDSLFGHVTLVAPVGGVSYLYALGGFNGSFNNSDKIYYAPINGNGSLGAWITNTIPMPVPLALASGVVLNGRMYLIGGNRSDGTYRSETYSAPINGDGSIGAWSAEPPLPQPLAGTASVAFAGTLSKTIFVLGGATSATQNSPQVYFADVLGGASLSTWYTSTGILPEAINSHAAVQAAGQIYIIGGNTGGVSSNMVPRKFVLSALIDESNAGRRLLDFGGGQSSWVGTEPLPNPRRWHGAVEVGGELFAVGGDGSTLPSGSDPSRLTFHGPTTGTASKYAPFGSYLSPVMNSGGPYQFTQLGWSTVMTNIAALTLTVRYHTSTDGITWGAWSGLLPSNPAQSTSLADPKSVAYSFSTPGQYFQYQAFFTTTSNVVTPFLLESHLRVEIPPPDLAVSKSTQASSALPGSVVSYTINYTNHGGWVANTVRLTETLPADTTFVDIGAGWVPAGGNRYVKTVPNVPVGGSGSVPFAIQVNNPLPPGTVRVTNTVQVGGDPLETNFADNTFALGTSALALVPGIDLRLVSISDGLSNPVAGQTVSYTVQYFNFGTDPASGVAMTVTVPAGMSGISGSGWTALGGGAFRYEIGTLASAQGGSVGLAAQVNPSVAGSSFLTTTATVGTSGVDVNLSNNTLSDTDYVQPGNLRLLKDDGFALVDLGQTLVYTLTYGNIGGAIVSGATITETPPLALVDVVGAAGWTSVGSSYVRSVGDVAPGAVGAVTFAVQVKGGLTTGTLITNTALIGSPSDDSTLLADNAAHDVDRVQPGGGPDLQILGVSAPQKVFVFHTFTVFVTVTNAGSQGTGTSFYLDLYLDVPPESRSSLGDTFATVDALGPGQTVVIPIPWQFNSLGPRQLWFQVDTCDQVGINCFDPSYGRVMESLELNNVFGPIEVQVEKSTIYLPFIRR